MHYILILISAVGTLNASMPQLPTLTDWTVRCVNSCPLKDMPGLKEFLIGKDKGPFENFCLSNRIAKWAEIIMIQEEFQKALKKRLNKKNWAGCAGRLNYNSIKSKDANLSNAYYVGLNVAPKTTFYLWGDRHGDAQSLPRGLCALQDDDIIDNHWKTGKNHILVLLGDYVNNGGYSLEAAVNLMVLYIQNKDCIAIRGNHECTDRPITRDWAIREATVKLSKELGTKAAEYAILFFQLLEKLPVAAFVAVPQKDGDPHHVLITHAAPDLGINPKKLLEKLKNRPYGEFIYCAIDPVTYNRRSNENPNAQAIINNPDLQEGSPDLEKYLNVTRESEPRDLSFCRDQLINENPEKPFEYLKHITTLAWGKSLIEAIMKDWEIFCIMRGHQHAHALDCKNDPALFGPMVELWKGDGASVAWEENSPKDREICQGDVITVQAAPDSIYGLSEGEITGEPQTETMYPGFSYDTIAVLKVTTNGALCLTKRLIPVLTRTEQTFEYNNEKFYV